jgi:serine/threonine protein kinase
MICLPFHSIEPGMADLQRVAKYRVRGLIRRGGMGALYLAYDPELEREVVIKVLRDDDDPALQERFAREAKAVARLRHPNIVTIFDYGIEDSRQYIVMEYIPGDTFADVIRRREALSLDRKLELIDGVCAGLSHAHASGIVHRDIKPANLMIDVDGAVKVLDFGIARTGAPTLTAEGDVIGTLNYMAPEQIMGGRVDVRSDVFAVGAVLYELLTYEPAFPGDVSDGVAARIVNAEPRPLAELCADAVPDLSRVSDKALTKQPDERYQDVAALRSDLAKVRRRLRSEPDPHAPAPDAAPPTELALRTGDTSIPAKRKGRRHEGPRWGVGVVAVAGMLAIAAALSWLPQTPLAPESRPVNQTTSTPDSSVPATPVSETPSIAASPPAPPLTTTPPASANLSPVAPTQPQPPATASRNRETRPAVQPSDARRAPQKETTAETTDERTKVAPPSDVTAVDGRARPLEPVPLPRNPGREEPQLPAPPVSEPSPAETDPAARKSTPVAPIDHERQIRAVVEAYVKTLSTSNQQVELVGRPAVNIDAERRTASATVILRYRLKGQAWTSDRKEVLELETRETAWTIVRRRD